jgi:RecA-family ATPase
LLSRVEIVTKEKLDGQKRNDLIARTGEAIEYREDRRAFVLFDYDSKGKPSEIELKNFWQALVKVLPDLKTAAHVVRRSTSSGLSRTDTGEKLPGSDGQHAFIIAEDGRDSARFLETLHQRCWLAGYGWIWVDKAGRMHDRSIIDRMVGASERLVFEGPPKLSGPLQQSRKPVATDGDVVDTLAICPPLTPGEQATFNKLVAAAKVRIQPEADKARAAYVEERVQTLIKRGMSEEAARQVAENQCEGVLLPEVELVFAGKEVKGVFTVADVLAEPERFEGQPLADPIEGTAYGTQTAKVFCRYDDAEQPWVPHPWIRSFAHGGVNYTLVREADEAASAEEPNKSKAPASALPIIMVRASDVKMRAKDWLWEGHLLRGALELLTGLPGVGKSQTQIHFMACATARLPWPDGAPAIEPVNVIMVTAEDSVDTEVVPRLKAAGADLERIHILKYIKTDKLKRQFLLAEDLVRLEQAIAQIGDVGLICIDPITAYMGGKTDSHKATEVRSQLGPLKDFSEGTNVAVSAITHPAKNAGARAIDHFIASQAFVAAARLGHACFEEYEENEETGEKTPTGRILFTHVKHNPHVKMSTLAYKIESITIYPEPYLQIETSRVVWEKEAVNISAEQAIAAARSNAKGKAKEEEASGEVVNFLRMMLDAGGGCCKQTEIALQAKALGFSDKEVRTAREKLAIVAKKDGYQGPWMWHWKDGKRPLRF